MPPITTLSADDDRAFVRQMRVIELSEGSVLAAVHDYYRASEQRSRWAREILRKTLIHLREPSDAPLRAAER